MNINQNNFGQDLGELSLANILKQDPGAIGGLGSVPGLGQLPEYQVDKDVLGKPTQANADTVAGFQAPDAAGGGMAAILGMQAMKQLGQAATQAPRQAPAPAPGVAPRGGRVELETPSYANVIDPRMYMMLQGGK